MVSPTNHLTRREEPDFVETWIKCLSAHARSKKLKDERNTGAENQIIDLSSAGCKAIIKITVMFYPRELEYLTFEEVVAEPTSTSTPQMF